MLRGPVSDDISEVERRKRTAKSTGDGYALSADWPAARNERSPKKKPTSMSSATSVNRGSFDFLDLAYKSVTSVTSVTSGSFDFLDLAVEVSDSQAARQDFRDAFGGCARHAAQGLVGVSADEAEEKAGLLHHHYPCLASMGIDDDFHDTLMHVSGNILKDNVGEQVKAHKQVTYIVPGTRSEDEQR